MSMSIKNKIAYYCLVVVSIYLIIYDLCFLYIADCYDASSLFPFVGQIEPQPIFIVQGVFSYLAELFKVAWVVVFMLVWNQPKPKVQLSLMIAALLLPAISKLIISNDVINLIVALICILVSLFISVALLKKCDKEFKPLLSGQIVFSSTYVLSIVLLLTQTSSEWTTVKTMLIIYMALSILAIIFALGRLRENRAVS